MSTDVHVQDGIVYRSLWIFVIDCLRTSSSTSTSLYLYLHLDLFLYARSSANLLHSLIRYERVHALPGIWCSLCSTFCSTTVTLHAMMMVRPIHSSLNRN